MKHLLVIMILCPVFASADSTENYRKFQDRRYRDQLLRLETEQLKHIKIQNKLLKERYVILKRILKKNEGFPCKKK